MVCFVCGRVQLLVLWSFTRLVTSIITEWSLRILGKPEALLTWPSFYTILSVRSKDLFSPFIYLFLIVILFIYFLLFLHVRKKCCCAFECSRIVSVYYEYHFGPLMAGSALQYLLYLQPSTSNQTEPLPKKQLPSESEHNSCYTRRYRAKAVFYIFYVVFNLHGFVNPNCSTRRVCPWLLVCTSPFWVSVNGDSRENDKTVLCCDNYSAYCEVGCNF